MIVAGPARTKHVVEEETPPDDQSDDRKGASRLPLGVGAEGRPVLGFLGVTMASFEDVRAVDGGGGRPELEVPDAELDGEVVVEVGRGKFEEVAAEGAYPGEDEGGGSEGGGQEGQERDAEGMKRWTADGEMVKYLFAV